MITEQEERIEREVKLRLHRADIKRMADERDSITAKINELRRKDKVLTQQIVWTNDEISRIISESLVK